MDIRIFPVMRLERFKALAKALKKELDLSHGHALLQLAQAHGYADYNELLEANKSSSCIFVESMRGEDLEQWIRQVASVFRTELDPIIGKKTLEEWFRRICVGRSDSEEGEFDVS
mgnify:CR=1 FL=1